MYNVVSVPYSYLFPPHHLIHHARVRLYELDHHGGDFLAGVGGHGGVVVVRLVEGEGGADGLEERGGRYAGQDEAGLVEGLGALRRGADADGGEGMGDGGEEGGLLGEGAAVGDDAGGMHLQAVVVVEAEGLVAAHKGVEREARLVKALAGARVAAIEYGQLVRLGYLVDGGEEGSEVGLRVDILLAVGTQENVLAALEAEALVYVAPLDGLEVLVEHLGHGAAAQVGALAGQAAVSEVAAGVLGVADVDVGDDVYDAAVRLLGQALVLAAVAGLHVEDGDVEPLGRDGGEARVGVAEDQKGVGLHLNHKLVRGGDDVADGLAEVVAHAVHIYVGVLEL